MPANQFWDSLGNVPAATREVTGSRRMPVNAEESKMLEFRTGNARRPDQLVRNQGQSAVLTYTTCKSTDFGAGPQDMCPWRIPSPESIHRPWEGTIEESRGWEGQGRV